MSTKESKSDRVTRLFERKVVLDELDLDDLKFVSLHIQQAYIHTNLKGAKKAKGDSKPNAFFQFRSALTEKVKELDLPSAPTWLSKFAGYLYTNKNWKEDTDKLEDEDELIRLHERFAAKNPIPEKKAKAAKTTTADDSEDEEAPKAKKAAKKVPVDSEDEEEEPAPKPKAKAKKEAPSLAKRAMSPTGESSGATAEEEEVPKPKAKTAPKKEVKAESEAEEEEAPKPKAKAPAKVAPKVRMTPEGGGEVQTINGKEYYTAQDKGKLKVWTVKDGEGDDFVGVYNFKTKEIDTEEDEE